MGEPGIEPFFPSSRFEQSGEQLFAVFTVGNDYLPLVRATRRIPRPEACAQVPTKGAKTKVQLRPLPVGQPCPLRARAHPVARSGAAGPQEDTASGQEMFS
jgi:hypothetical protein